MHSILFSIGPFHVYGYGFMIAVGIICAFTIGCFLAKRSGLDDDALFSMGLVGIVGGIIGAKLLYYIVEFPSIIADPSILLNFGEGFVVYGGLIAGFLSPLIYTRIKKLSFLPYIDCAVPGVAFAQGCGRIGCFLAGCCYGRETTSHFGVVFPASSQAPAGVSLIPTQLISAGANFINMIILLVIAYNFSYTVAKNKGKNKSLPAGGIGYIYMILYGIGRFLIEFLRNDYRGEVGFLSTSQFISIFFVICGAGLLLFSVRKHRAVPA